MMGMYNVSEEVIRGYQDERVMYYFRRLICDTGSRGLRTTLKYLWVNAIMPYRSYRDFCVVSLWQRGALICSEQEYRLRQELEEKNLIIAAKNRLLLEKEAELVKQDDLLQECMKLLAI